MRFRSLLLPLAITLSHGPALAADPPTIVSQADATRAMSLEVGQTRLIHLSQKIVRVSVADPEVADVRVVTPLQVLVTAKGVGYTHLILWGESDKPLVLEISCTRNLTQLRGQIKELFPGEQISVSSAGELVVLSGKVSDVRLPSRVAEVAKLHSKQLANLVEVSGNQQVQLEVRFAEVSRSGVRKMGFNFLWRDLSHGGGNVGALNSADTPAGSYLARSPETYVPGTGVAPAPPFAPVSPVGDAFDFIFSTGLSDFPFSAILSILAQEGLAKLLSEPTLVAFSGQEAKFHAGGEVPIVIAQQLGTFSVRFKKFGVQLKFVPTVLGKKTINLKVFAEVSEPDPSVGVVLTGFQVPGFKTRNSETTIRLKDGQSFAIAGLLSDDIRSTVKKVPLLGEIPILGALFRSTAFQRDETELLVVVKAHMVKPLEADEVPPLPGDNEVNDPNDFQLFLLGSLTSSKQKPTRGRRAKRTAEHRGGPSGPIGFARD